MLTLPSPTHSFSGVVLVSLSDSSQDKLTGTDRESIGVTHSPSLLILGDALALLSALFYALYVTLLKVRIKSESRIDMQLFFGFVGLFNILACWPMGIVLHLIGVESFEWPATSRAITALLINVRAPRLPALNALLWCKDRVPEAYAHDKYRWP